MLSIMSFNIRYPADKGDESWESRRERLVPLIKNADPDLIGFQEVTQGQYPELAARLPEYSSVGAGRDDGLDKGERAAIFFKRDRFKLLESGDFWLSETPEKPSFGWDAVCIRICTYARLLDNKTGREFAHYNTHLDHVGQVAMLEGAKLVRAHMLASGAPAFVTGDFNVHEKSAPYLVMTDGLRDAKYAARSSMSWGTFHGYQPGESIRDNSPIDYLFFTDGRFTAESYAVLVNGGPGSYTSDHYPILVKLAQV